MANGAGLGHYSSERRNSKVMSCTHAHAGDDDSDGDGVMVMVMVMVMVLCVGRVESEAGDLIIRSLSLLFRETKQEIN